MSAALLGVIAALLSSVGLATLAMTDPKGRLDEQRRNRHFRLPAVSLALLPGIALAGTGRGVGFLIWIAGTALLGWTSAGFASRRRATDPFSQAS